ncbi:MAG: hypothetical protein MRJ68_19335 [Nitrospira sp.]|nr:hypothetical protein [Nitrospira sp.]
MTRYLLLIVCLVVPVSAMAASNDCLVSATAPTLQAGQSAPCSLDTSGNLRTSGTFSGSITGADGSITDGVNAAVKATVQDYTNSNPLAVILTDTNGDPATLGAGGGGTEYAQGTASTTTDAMTMAGCVRVDTPAVASGVIDGDRARCIVDSTNRMWVHVGVVDGTVAVTQSGTWNLNALTSITNPVAVTGTFWQATQPVSGTVTANAGTGNFTVVQPTGTNLHVVCDSGCSSSAGFGDNSAFTFGTTAINPIGGVLDDTATNAATENSAAVARITAQKALHMNLRNNSGTEIGTAGAPIRTDPTGSTTQPVSGTVSITANSAVNVAQMNGVATSMGVGASGTGTQRVASLIHDGTDTAQVTATGGGSLQVECSAGCSGGTQYAEDSVHVSGDTLTLAGVVRQDATAALAADGDRTLLQVNANGHLKVVNDNPNLAADNSTLSTAKVPVLAGTVSTSAPTWTSGNQSALSLQTDGSVRSAITNFPSTASTSAVSIRCVNTAGNAFEACGGGGGGGGTSLADNSAFTFGSTSVTPLAGVLDDTATNAATENSAAIMRITPQKGMHVNLRNQSGTELGTSSAPIRIDPTGTTAQTVNNFTAANLKVEPVGNIAHDAADSGNPVKIGCQARTTNRTAVADADRADCVSDKNGQIVVTPMAPRDRVVRSGVVTLTNTTETTLIAAGGAGVFRDLTYLKCTNNSATLVRVDLRDATAGTVIDSWALAASGGGFNLAFTVPYAQATANNNWTVQLSGSVTDVRCSAQAIEKN